LDLTPTVSDDATLTVTIPPDICGGVSDARSSKMSSLQAQAPATTISVITTVLDTAAIGLPLNCP
jgi:hypothetical protein